MERLGNNTSYLGYEELSAMSQEQLNQLLPELKIESAAESLFDLIRYKEAYGELNSVKQLEKEFVFIFNLLTPDEQQQALEKYLVKKNFIHNIQ